MRFSELNYPIAQTIIIELDNLCSQNLDDRKRRTCCVKHAISLAGRSFGYAIYHTQTCDEELPLEIRKNYVRPEFGEWLYDVFVAKKNDDDTWSTKVVVECEWERDIGYIKEDFEKLMIAGSGLRVMLYDGRTTGVDSNTFRDWISLYKGNRKNDIYLLAAYNETKASKAAWNFHVIKYASKGSEVHEIQR